MKKIVSGLFFIFVPGILGPSSSAVAFEQCRSNDISYTQLDRQIAFFIDSPLSPLAKKYTYYAKCQLEGKDPVCSGYITGGLMSV